MTYDRPRNGPSIAETLITMKQRQRFLDQWHATGDSDRISMTGAIVASLLTILLIAFTALTTWHTHRREAAALGRLNAVDALVWKMIMLHDARANAAEMAVLAGDEESIRRYKQLARESTLLAQQLHENRDLTPAAATVLGQIDTLTRLEDSVIDSVAVQPRPRSLFFAQYASAAKDYRKTLEMVPRQTAEHRLRIGSERVAHSRRVVGLLATGAVAIAIAWILVIRGMMRQIGSRRTAERMYRDASRQNLLILEATADGIVGLDGEGAVVFVNPAADRMLGTADAETTDYEVVQEAISEARDALTPALREEGHAAAREFDLVRRDGSVLPVEISASALRKESGDGDGEGSVLVIRDITPRREIDRLKSEFVATVSHELRTPLTSIRGSLGLLSAGLFGTLNDKGKRMLEIAVSNTDRLVRLINDILDIERIESGAVAMQRVDCNAANLVFDVTDSMRSLAEKNQIRLLASAEAVGVLGDSDRLSQVLTNLIGNAIKFSPPGTTVNVSVSRRTDHAVFSVRDHGRGIPADKLNLIFERFEQVDSSDAREKGGTGLGLAICRSIVRQHGGRIWVESTPGQGSNFSFTIPLSDSAATAAANAKPETEAAPAPRPRVLLCEDDRETLDAISKMLVDAGYDVVAVRSGEDAIAQASASHPDVILLDIVLDGMSGWQTLSALHDAVATRDVPVIVLSGLSAGGGEAGEVAAWIEKPATSDALYRALDEALAATLRSRHVVIAEDDADLGGVLVALFERDGITATHVTSGAAAVDTIEQTNPDLVVLDLGLPGLDGFEVFDWMRRRPRWAQTPIMIYSALDLTRVQVDRVQRGPTETLMKSRITPEDFEKRALRLLKAIVGRNARSGGNDAAIEPSTDGARGEGPHDA